VFKSGQFCIFLSQAILSILQSVRCQLPFAFHPSGPIFLRLCKRSQFSILLSQATLRVLQSVCC